MTTEENAKFSEFSFTKKEIKELIKNNPEYIQYIEKVFKERKFKSIKDLTITDICPWNGAFFVKTTCSFYLITLAHTYLVL